MANAAAEQQLAAAMLRIQALEQTVSAERARSEMRAEMERRDRERDREAQILRAELAAQRAEHRTHGACLGSLQRDPRSEQSTGLPAGSERRSPLID